MSTRQKIILNIFIAVNFAAFSFATPSFAVPLSASKSFTLSASIQAATGISINASKVDTASNQFSPVTGLALSFNPMVPDLVNGTFVPDHYFAIDVGTTGGAGVPTVTVKYTEGANPNNPGGPSHGLGTKSTATFVKISGTTETQLTNHGPKKLLINTDETIAPSEIVGAYLRVYVGIVTGGTGVPAGGEPFTNADVPGTYDGTLVVSATTP